ncbi:39S ribosomal protein S30, mitochondrial [Entelurus aequoreus]|uniref:39S ribosomal protein S30, mitochondrial n=1 Tax=Entelurus aequoreus TaxID=161455 RepID=UPI002B1E4A79|nr:39S ribosomal protein S30, mitochondrial [Entelurus aequoreus]XP_061881072.1 39S ribosomal protein S30, mitochondrial [Entelurus aequoreus]XP_061881073.1 39S ribosomal protein S30, mitochondrial [Entelurus aequoreus]
MAVRARLSFRLPPHLLLPRNHKLVHSEAAVKEAVYPPIKPSLTAKSQLARQHQAQVQIERIKGSPVEEKLHLLTRIQRKKFVVYPQTFARDADRWYQHLTKTAYIPGLPETLGLQRPLVAGEESSQSAPTQVPGIDDEAFEEIRSLVTGVILQEHWDVNKRKVFLYRKQELIEGPFLRALITALTHRLAVYNPLLLLSSLDRNPQVGFYWRKGERILPKGHRRGHLEPTRFQIDDQPLCQIRVTEQLPQMVPMEDSYSADVPDVPFAPNLMPMFKRQCTNHIFTGSKLPDPACFGHTQFHLVPDRYHRERMARKQQSDQIEVFLRANAIASLFAWTSAQASYQGFWNHEDLSRPFVSQAVITDGKFFSFFCYQLNTLALSAQTDVNNPRKNLLWGTQSLRLFEGVEDGRVVGLSDDTLKLLLRFFLQR